MINKKTKKYKLQRGGTNAPKTKKPPIWKRVGEQMSQYATKKAQQYPKTAATLGVVKEVIKRAAAPLATPLYWRFTKKGQVEERAKEYGGELPRILEAAKAFLTLTKNSKNSKNSPNTGRKLNTVRSYLESANSKRKELVQSTIDNPNNQEFKNALELHDKTENEYFRQILKANRSLGKVYSDYKKKAENGQNTEYKDIPGKLRQFLSNEKRKQQLKLHNEESIPHSLEIMETTPLFAKFHSNRLVRAKEHLGNLYTIPKDTLEKANTYLTELQKLQTDTEALRKKDPQTPDKKTLEIEADRKITIENLEKFLGIEPKQTDTSELQPKTRGPLSNIPNIPITSPAPAPPLVEDPPPPAPPAPPLPSRASKPL